MGLEGGHRSGTRSGQVEVEKNLSIMELKDNSKRASDKSHAAIPLPERLDRPESKKGNPPQKTVGTKTPGLKKDEDMPEATERKARRDGKAPKPKV